MMCCMCSVRYLKHWLGGVELMWRKWSVSVYRCGCEYQYLYMQMRGSKQIVEIQNHIFIR